MKQQVRFNRPIDLGDHHFKAGATYTFTVTPRQWIFYRRERLTTLSAFATWFTDQGYADFVDARAA